MGGLENFLQLTINGAVNGSVYGLLGLGFGIILGVSGRFHVAFAVTYTLAGFVAAWTTGAGWPWWSAIIAAMAASAIAGVLMEMFVYFPISLRARGDVLLLMFVGSLALSIIGSNLLGLAAMANTSMPVGGFNNTGVNVGPATVSTLNILQTVVAWGLIVAVAVVLKRTNLGRMIRATRANWEMALCVGIDPRRIYIIVFAIGSALGAVAAVFNATATSATSTMGLVPFFYALVVAFVAGVSAAPIRIGLIGLGLGLVESWSSTFLPSSWTSLVVFGILFIYVALRPVQVKSLFARRVAPRPAGVPG